MKILKFGGTSVGKPERMKSIAKLINDEERKIVVLSALSGTTNALVSISEELHHREKNRAYQRIDELKAHYQAFIQELYSTEAGLAKGKQIIDEHFAWMKSVANTSYFTNKEERMLLAEGELLSTQMFQAYLEEIKLSSVLIPALEYMKVDRDGEPDLEFIEENLAKQIQQYPHNQIFVTQGYICRNPIGEIDNLKRGGSDYTASLVGAAVRASEVQIWTDIDGMHNNDPRIVKNTFPVAELSFEEAAELAYFGAKILHPASIHPARQFNIPVRLLNTMQPEAKGTIITNTPMPVDGRVKAIAAKDGISAIKIKSSRMLLAYGFLRKVFEVFEKFKTPIDMITTSEVAVSLTIDKADHLDEISKVLKFFGTVEVDADQTIICIVGDFVSDYPNTAAQIFNVLKDVPVRMISYGGSKHNISILINTTDKEKVLNLLNDNLFEYAYA
jgi:aspartate kinase